MWGLPALRCDLHSSGGAGERPPPILAYRRGSWHVSNAAYHAHEALSKSPACQVPDLPGSVRGFDASSAAHRSRRPQASAPAPCSITARSQAGHVQGPLCSRPGREPRPKVWKEWEASIRRRYRDQGRLLQAERCFCTPIALIRKSGPRRGVGVRGRRNRPVFRVVQTGLMSCPKV